MVTYSFSLTLPGMRVTPPTAEAAIDLITDHGWDKPLRYFSEIVTGGAEKQRRPGMIRPQEVRDAVSAALLHRDVVYVRMSTSARNTPDFATCTCDTRVESWQPHLFATGQRSEGSTITRATWLQSLITFAANTSSTMGVIFVTRDSDEVTHELGVLRGYAPTDEGHHMHLQLARMSKHREQVGTRYVRFPRWGTLYSHEHVTALGGTPRIIAAVQPAVVRELSGGVYFQMTDSLDTALSQESIAKQRAFEEVAAPLLPPPV